MRPSRLSVLALLSLSAAGILAVGKAVSQAPAPPALVWPIACQVGVTCQIEHYIDHDPSPAIKDFACGTRTYEGHDGTDIRLPDMAAQRRGVAVLAAADGRVFRIRDGVEDVSANIVGPEAVNAIGCGNAVVLVHPGGFKTLYCHMAKGSVLVKAGDMVKAGQPVGKVGLSGLTNFPHLHFTLLQNDKTVDPFAYGAADGTCNGGRSLWTQTPAYAARVIVNNGFADAALTLPLVEDGNLRVPAAAADLMVAYVRSVGLKTGDVQEMVLRGPDGAILAQNRAAPLPRNQDQRLMFIGKRRPAQGWPKGRYQAAFTVTGPDGKTALSRTFALTM